MSFVHTFTWIYREGHSTCLISHSLPSSSGNMTPFHGYLNKVDMFFKTFKDFINNGKNEDTPRLCER